MPLDPAQIGLLTILGTLFVALLVFMHSRKGKEAERTTNFLAFMRVWESEVVTGSRIHHKVANEFDSKRHQLLAQATGMELNYRRQKLSRFRELVQTINGMTPGEVEGRQGHEKLLDAIRELLYFVEPD